MKYVARRKAQKTARSVRRVRRDLEAMAIILSDAHPVTSDKLLCEVIDRERDREKNKTHHEERAVMRAPAHHLAHFLRDDSSHRVDGLKNGAQSLCEIRNRDPVSRAKQDYHCFADDTT